MKNILVLCTGNSCRSQIAEGYLRQYLNGKAVVFSAGVNNHEINDNAIKIMKEDGVDISTQTSNHINEYENINFDYIITVCDHAYETCPAFYSNELTTRIHKNFFDPSSIDNSSNIDKAFRKCREEIKKFCFDFSKKFVRFIFEFFIYKIFDKKTFTKTHLNNL